MKTLWTEGNRIIGQARYGRGTGTVVRVNLNYGNHLDRTVSEFAEIKYDDGTVGAYLSLELQPAPVTTP